MIHTGNTHPILIDIRNHQHVHILHPPITTSPLVEWIDTITTIAKNANKEAKKSTTKYTKDYILKAVLKYRQMYEKNPQKINRKVFKNIETSSLDSIIDRQNNILTNPEDIAWEIYTQQSISNRPTVPTCHYQHTHPLHCTCGVRQYPWHDLRETQLTNEENPKSPYTRTLTKKHRTSVLKHVQTPSHNERFGIPYWLYKPHRNHILTIFDHILTMFDHRRTFRKNLTNPHPTRSNTRRYT